MIKRKKIPWYLSCTVMIVLSVLTFTPVITPAHTYKPMLMGIPYTLWTGFLLTVALVLITYIGASVHFGKNDKEVS